MIVGLTSLNSGNYETAVSMLKFYPFLQDKYLDAVRGAGDQCMDDGHYLTAVTWYEQLGDAGTESINRAYCAEAARKLNKGGSVADFLSLLNNVEDTELRDQTILDGAALLLDRSERENAVSLLEQVQQADTAPLYQRLNSMYFAETAALFTTINTDYNGDESAAFEQLRQAVEILKNCKDSPLAKQTITVMEKLLKIDTMNDFYFSDEATKISLHSHEDPEAAGSMLRSIWYCYSHIAGPADNYHNIGLYHAKENIVELGHLTASMSGFSAPAEESWMEALAHRADEGDIRRMKQGLYTSSIGLSYEMNDFGPAGGGTPKLLFLRQYLPANRTNHDSNLEYAIDLNMMELLPLEWWPETLEEVTHLVVLYYNHIEHGKYKDYSNVFHQFSSGYPAIQETGSVRIYQTSDSRMIYESETLTGPVPPASVSMDNSMAASVPEAP